MIRESKILLHQAFTIGDVDPALQRETQLFVFLCFCIPIESIWLGFKTEPVWGAVLAMSCGVAVAIGSIIDARKADKLAAMED